MAVVVSGSCVDEVRALADVAVEVHIPETVKGLEFGAVVVVEPAALAGATPAPLYIALTRSTARLVVVHARPLPPPLDRLAS